MNRQLEILSRYLPYRVEVECDIEDGTKAKGVLLSLDTYLGIGEVKEGPKIHQDIDLEDIKPILYPFEALTQPILEGGGIPAVEIAGLTTEDCDMSYFDKKANLGTGFITVISKDQEYRVTIFNEWDVSVTDLERNEDLFPNNQALIQQKLISWGFAVGLEEHEYIKKEVQP